MKWRGVQLQKHVWLVIGILAVGFLLRLAAIGWGFTHDQRLQYASSVHDDERRELRAIGQMNPSRFDISPDDMLREGTLHPYLVAASLLVAEKTGFVELVNDEAFYREHAGAMSKLFVVGRLFGVIADMLAVFMLYIIGRRFFSPAIGIVAALGYALSPIELAQATYLRPHTFANLLFICILYFAMRIATGEKKVWLYFLSGITVGCIFQTRTFMLMAVVLPVVAECIRATRGNDPFWQRLRTGVRVPFSYSFSVVMSGILLGSVAANPVLLLEPRRVIGSILETGGAGGYAGNIFSVFSRLAQWGIVLLTTIPQAITLPVAVAALLGLMFAAYAMRRNADEPYRGPLGILLLFFAAFGLPYMYIVLGGSLVLMPRYTMPLLPFLLILTAYALEFVFKKISLPTIFKITIFSCVLASVLGYALLYDIAYVRAARAMHPLERLSGWITANVPSDATIGITKKNAFLKNIDFARYSHVIELGGFLDGLEKAKPDVVIVFPYQQDLYLGGEPIDDYLPQLTAQGYREEIRFRNSLTFAGISFNERSTRWLEYESRIYLPQHF